MPGLLKSYRVYNCAMPTTAHQVYVTTGTSIKTMMQIDPTVNIIPFGWGYAFDSNPAAAVYVELLTTGAIAATGLTAFVAADIIKYGESGGTASAINLGTSASGYSATGEGAIVATRVIDVGPPMANYYSTRLELDHESSVLASEFLRVRAHTSSAVNMLCWVDYLEA